jgi:hypothetical protein
MAFAFASVLGAVVGLMGPFGNYDHASIGQRIPYWIGMAWAATLMFGAPLETMQRLRPRLMSNWVAILILVLLVCIPFAYFTRFIAVQVWPPLGRIFTIVDWYGQCAVISVPGALGYWFLALRPKRRMQAAEPAPSPASFREAICLQMEDHYVRVHGERGSQLVLMTLSDAIARTSRLGLQVHRSWWVATEAVEAAVVDGRNVRLRLRNGIEAPVARTAVAKVRDAGLLQ